MSRKRCHVKGGVIELLRVRLREPKYHSAHRSRPDRSIRRSRFASRGAMQGFLARSKVRPRRGPLPAYRRAIGPGGPVENQSHGSRRFQERAKAGETRSPAVSRRGPQARQPQEELIGQFRVSHVCAGPSISVGMGRVPSCPVTITKAVRRASDCAAAGTVKESAARTAVTDVRGFTNLNLVTSPRSRPPIDSAGGAPMPRGGT